MNHWAMNSTTSPQIDEHARPLVMHSCDVDWRARNDHFCFASNFWYLRNILFAENARLRVCCTLSSRARRDRGGDTNCLCGKKGGEEDRIHYREDLRSGEAFPAAKAPREPVEKRYEKHIELLRKKLAAITKYQHYG